MTRRSPAILVFLAVLALCRCATDDAAQVAIPAGPFLMGYDFGNRDEGPMRVVRLDAYLIDRYEVTNRRYHPCVEAGLCREPTESGNQSLDAARQPVLGVSWVSANAFCRFEGRRLPTEAEWEKAARGADGRLYPWGFGVDLRRANTVSTEDGYHFSAPVGALPRGASPYGAMDMAGNAKEWVADWYDENYYSTGPILNPTGPETGTIKVVRGGSWKNDQLNVRVTLRNPVPPGVANEYYGFRCASDAR